MTRINKHLVKDKKKINNNIVLNFEEFFIIIQIISYVSLKKFEIVCKRQEQFNNKLTEINKDLFEDKRKCIKINKNIVLLKYKFRRIYYHSNNFIRFLKKIWNSREIHGSNLITNKDCNFQLIYSVH